MKNVRVPIVAIVTIYLVSSLLMTALFVLVFPDATRVETCLVGFSTMGLCLLLNVLAEVRGLRSPQANEEAP